MSEEIKKDKLKLDGTVDLRKNNGGGGRGAGRPKGSKDKVILIKKLDHFITPDKVMRKLKKIMYNDEDAVLQLKAIQLYMNYRFGKPVETKDVNIFQEQPLFVLNETIDIQHEDIINDILGEEPED